MPTDFAGPTSTSYDRGDSDYPGSIRSGWFVAVNAKTATPKAGTWYDLSDAGGDAITTFQAPKGAFSTLILRLRRLAAYTTTSTDPAVVVVGRYRVNNEIVGEWMLLPNRNGDDGIATSITLVTDDTNDIEDGGYRFTEHSNSLHWFDTMGCNEFAVLVKTAFVGSPSISGASTAQVMGKFL